MKSWICFFALFLIHQNGMSDVQQLFGAGSSSASMAGANRTYKTDALVLFQNPALLGNEKDGSFSFGLLGAIDFFKSIDSVVTDNTYTGGNLETSDVDTDVPDTFLFLLGYTTSLNSKLNFAINLMLPADKFMELTSKDLYYPQYAAYLSDSQRAMFALGASYDLGSSWIIGLATHIYLTTGASLEARLPPDSSPSVLRTSNINSRIVVQPKLSPTVGILKKWERWSFSAQYQSLKDYEMQYDYYAELDVLGTAPLVFEGSSSYFYDPETWSLSLGYKLSQWSFHFTLDYENWKKFEGTYIKVNFITATNQLVQYSESTGYKNILIPRFGLQHWLNDENVIRFGYAYKKAPTPGLSGATNFIDSNKHIFGLGYRFLAKNWLGFDILNFDVHMQGHILENLNVLKSESTDIGYPGYEVGGFVLNYGLVMSAEI